MTQDELDLFRLGISDVYKLKSAPSVYSPNVVGLDYSQFASDINLKLECVSGRQMSSYCLDQVNSNNLVGVCSERGCGTLEATCNAQIEGFEKHMVHKKLV